MIEFEAIVREWGGSLGATFPKDKLKKEKIKAGDKIKLLIIRERKGMLNDIWGIDKSLRPTAELLKEVDREGWDD